MIAMAIKHKSKNDIIYFYNYKDGVRFYLNDDEKDIKTVFAKMV